MRYWLAAGLLLPIGLLCARPQFCRAADSSAPSVPRRPVSRYQDDPRLQATVLLRPAHEHYELQNPYREPRLLVRARPEEWRKLLEPGGVDPIRVVGAEVVSVEAVAEALSRETKVPLKLESEWRLRWVALPQRSRPGWEHMDLLAHTLGGHWYRVGAYWVLAESEPIARLSVMTPDEWNRFVEPIDRRLFQSLTPVQWQALGAGRELPFRNLTPVQGRVVLEKIRALRYAPFRQQFPPTAEAMRGAGVFLAVAGSGKGATLDIGVPEVPHLGKRTPIPRHSVSFTGDHGELLWGVPPPR